MRIRSRVTQDRRKLSRVATRLDCRFEFESKSHNGVIIDLSPKGAFISAAVLPPKGSRICLSIRSNFLAKELILEAKVLRGASAMSDHGQIGRFGVEFCVSPLELVKLIGKIAAR